MASHANKYFDFICKTFNVALLKKLPTHYVAAKQNVNFCLIACNILFVCCLFIVVFITSPNDNVLNVSFCDGPLSVVCSPVRQQFYLNSFFETVHWILT